MTDQPADDASDRTHLGVQANGPDIDARLDGLERALAGGGARGHAHEDAEPPRLGIVAVRLSDTASADEPEVSRRGTEPFPPASTIKVYVLQALLEAVAAREISLDQPLELNEEDQVTGSGVLKVLSPGTAYPVIDVATLMIVVSDNTATNMLIDLLGAQRIRDATASRGWDGTYVRGKLQVGPVIGDQKPSPSRTTARDLADYFLRLWRGELLPRELTDLAKQIYGRQQFTELGRALDYDQYSAEIGMSDLLIASKSGSVRGVRNDAGVLTVGALTDSPTDVVIAVMTDGCADRRFHPENLGARIVGEATAAVLAHMGLAAGN